MLLDTGSQRRYITENLAKTLNLTLGKPNNITLVTFGSKKPQKIKSPSTTMDITLRDGSTLTINAKVIPSITRTVYRGPIYLGCLQKADCFLNQYDLADTLPCKGESSTIDLLVGNDYYLDLVISKKVEIQPVLYLLESNLGWILSGRTSEYAVKKQESSMLVLTYETDIERESHLFTSVDKLLPVKANLQDFWNLETIGINDSPVDPQDSEALKVFHYGMKGDDIIQASHGKTK